LHFCSFCGNIEKVFYITDVERLNKSIAKKMSMDSQEFKENDFWIVEGTPQELWNEFWDLMKLFISKPLNRNVARKFYAEY